MSIALRSLSNQEKQKAIQRRLKIGDKDLKGLGYWGAHDASKYKKISSVK